MRITERQLRRIIKEELLQEIQIVMSHDPSYFGANMLDDTGLEELPVVSLPLRRLVGFEHDSKMLVPKHRRNMLGMVRALRDGGPSTLPPILVRQHPTLQGRWQVIDGHHRFHAARTAGLKSIRAQVVPDQFIEDIDVWTGERED